MTAKMARPSTEQVAREVGIGHATLERWLASGKVPSPKTIRIGKFKFRDWSPQDVSRVRKFKQKNYGKKLARKSKRRTATRRR